MRFMPLLAVATAVLVTACSAPSAPPEPPRHTPAINQQAALDFMKSAPSDDTTVMGKKGTRAIVLQAEKTWNSWYMFVLKADGSSAEVSASDGSEDSLAATVAPGDYIVYLAEDGATASAEGVRVLRKTAIPDSNPATSSPSTTSTSTAPSPTS